MWKKMLCGNGMLKHPCLQAQHHDKMTFARLTYMYTSFKSKGTIHPPLTALRNKAIIVCCQNMVPAVNCSKIGSFITIDRPLRQFHSTVKQSAPDEKPDDEGDDFTDEENEKVKAMIQEFYKIPGSGHKVLILQPENNLSGKNTTPELQLEESCALVQTLSNWEVVDTVLIRIKDSRSEKIFSQVKLDSLSKKIQALPISAVFVSVNNLSYSQVIYLQEIWNLPVFDRYAIVLQIFKEHARTKEAKLQVAMAEIGFLEQSIVDVRNRGDINISDNLAISGRMLVQSRLKLLGMRKKKLSNELMKVKKQRVLARKNRQKKSVPVIAVVGYTNCGKTTLIKALTGDSDMEPKDQLFATLDVTAHGGVLKGSMKCVFMDTVGFIADIPLRLVDAFNATLEDAMIADVILHVCDVSHPDRVAQEQNVDQTLASLIGKDQQKKIHKVGNKADKLLLLEPKDFEQPVVPLISASSGQGLDELQEKLYDMLVHTTNVVEKKIKIPMDGEHLRWLKKYATVGEIQISEDSQHFIVDIVISQNSYQKFKNLFGKPKITHREIMQ